MDITILFYIGLSASTLTSLAFADQVYIRYKTKTKSSLSYITLFMNIIGQLLWLTYGIFKQDKIIATTAVVTVTMYILLYISTIIFR